VTAPDIRRFVEEDRPALERLMDAFGDELTAMDPYGRVIRAPGMGPHAVARMVEGAAAHEGLVLVAQGGGAVIGFVAGEVHRRPDEERFEVVDYLTGEVTELYVVPDRRGGGVGRQLLERLEGHFRDRGCGAVHIEVFAPNSGARAFYTELGYTKRDIDLFKLL
jgi:GNAT superfamily N-acetyltransferase